MAMNGAADHTVPLAALEAERGKRQQLENDVNDLKQTLANLGGQITGMQRTTQSQQTHTQPKKVYSTTELDDMVDAGTITRARADEVREAQMVERVAEQVGSRVTTQIKQDQLVSTVTGEFDSFIKAIPKIAVAGTPERQRVADEYARLVGLGQPESKATEVIAMEMAFGKLSRVQSASGKQADRQTHQETGGGGSSRSDSDDADPKGSPPSELSAGRKAYYADQIAKGVLSDWNAVRDELQHSNKDMLKRADARG